MKRILLAAAAATAMAAPAIAHNYAGDLVCSITDKSGNALTYSFANNTFDDPNVDAYTMTGSFAETAFTKNGQTTERPQGSRPVWKFTITYDVPNYVVPNHELNEVLESQSNLGWSLVLDQVTRPGVWLFHASARLVHGGSTVGSGECNRDSHNHQPAVDNPARIPDASQD